MQATRLTPWCLQGLDGAVAVRATYAGGRPLKSRRHEFLHEVEQVDRRRARWRIWRAILWTGTQEVTETTLVLGVLEPVDPDRVGVQR